MTTIEIMLLVVSVFFVLLVLYAIKLLATTCRTFEKTNATLESIKKQIDDLGHEPKNLLRHANELTADLTHKMKKLNPLFCAIHSAGISLEQQTCHMHKPHICPHCHHPHTPNDTSASHAERILQMALIGTKLWQDYKERS